MFAAFIQGVPLWRHFFFINLILLRFKVSSERFFTRISKQVLLFGICGFKNCNIESQVVNISVGHPVYGREICLQLENDACLTTYLVQIFDNMNDIQSQCVQLKIYVSQSYSVYICQFDKKKVNF